MDKTDNELQDSQTPEVEESLESLALPETVEASQFQELVEKNKKLFARAKKAEEDKKTLKEKLSASEPPKEVAKPASANSVEVDKFAKLELKTEGYTSEEAEFILRNGGDKNNPFVKAAIESMRAKQKVVEATPAPSSRSVLVDNKPWTQLSREEKAATYSDTFQKLVAKGKGK